MVRIDIVVANEDLKFGKYRFNKGEEYYSRMSKDGSQILIKDNNDRWYGIVNRYFTLYNWMQKKFKENFTIINTIYVKNYEEAKKITK